MSSLPLRNRLAAFAAAVALAAIPPLAIAEPPAEGDAAETPTTATVPAVDPDSLAILEDLDAAGAEHTNIRAEIDYHVVLGALGDTEERTGWVAYQAAIEGDPNAAGEDAGGMPAKFRIHFDTLKQGEGRAIRDRIDYAFDGQWLSIAKHRIKQLTRYQLAAPGTQVEAMRLGRGPFPIPFGQETDDVLEYFEVSTRPLADEEPEGTRYLKLVTREKHEQEIDFKTLEMWVSEERNLPARIVSIDDKDNVTTVTFEEIETGVEFEPEMFHLPHKSGWQLKVERFE